MSRKSLAKVVVLLLMVALGMPVASAAEAEADFATTLAKLLSHLEAAEAEVQAELEAVDRCIDDPDCVVIGDPSSFGAWFFTRDELQLIIELLGVGKEAQRIAVQQPEAKRELAGAHRASLVSERADLVEMRRIVVAELASVTRQAGPPVAVADPSAAAAGDAGGSGSGPFEGMRTVVLDVNGYRVTVPVGDHVEYTVHCFATSLETQQDASAPPRRAANEQELVESIKNHPNACVPDAYYDRQLVIDVLVRQADGGPRLIGRVEGYDPGSGS